MTKTQLLVGFAMLWRGFTPMAAAQTLAANPLTSIKRIYVQNLGGKNDAESARKDLQNDLKKSKAFELVDSAAQADAVLTGEAEIYVKGYYSLNPRSGVSTSNGHPIYGGSLTVELKDKSGETVWSYLATSRPVTGDPAHELSKDVVKHLVSERQKKEIR